MQQGAAYVFVKPSIGWSNMTQVAELSPSDGYAYLRFGVSVAISGNTIVVGTNPNSGDGGAAYVFEMPSSGWKNMTENAELSVPYEAYSVGIGRNNVVVGVPSEPVDSNFAAGAAFVFVKPESGWVTTATYAAELTASDSSYSASFGTSLAISDRTIVIGAPDATVGANQLQGEAYVFVEPVTGWKSTTETAKLIASDGGASDDFGTSVAVIGSTVAVGAPQHQSSSGSVGAAYIFSSFTRWVSATQTAELTVSGNECQLGMSVAVSYTQLAAGTGKSSCTDVNGTVFVYNKPSTGWETTAQANVELTEPDQQQTVNFFGIAVAIDDSTIVAGDPWFAVIDIPGIVYVF